MIAPKPTPSAPALVTVAQFHGLLAGSVGLHALRAAVRDGRIKSILVGRRKRLIPTSELTAWPERETTRA